MKLLCPMDSLPLSRAENCLVCEKGHSFDRAKEGYWNLLLVQNKASANPGDSQEMVEARRRFLGEGHFSPLAEKLIDFCAAVPHQSILDAGCGEGYYLDKLQTAFPKSECLGIDISKHAIKAAAKKHKAIQWAVASNKLLPVEAVDVLVCLFGFPVWESFKKAKHIILVDPAPGHLKELREIIYPEVRETKLASLEQALAAGFSLEREEAVKFSFQPQELQDLLTMTPHSFRISQEGKDRLAHSKDLAIQASVVFRLLKS